MTIKSKKKYIAILQVHAKHAQYNIYSDINEQHAIYPLPAVGAASVSMEACVVISAGTN